MTKSPQNQSLMDLSLAAQKACISRDLDTQPLYRVEELGSLVLFELPNGQKQKGIKVIDEASAEAPYQEKPISV